MATEISPEGYREIDKFRRYCISKNKDPLMLARACYTTACAYTSALAAAGEVEDANENIQQELRWRGIYEVLSGGKSLEP